MDDDKYILKGPPIDPSYAEHADKTLSEYLIEILLSRGNEVLMVDEKCGEKLSADQLVRYSFKLANHLTSLGYGKGDVIGIISENRIEYIVPILATLHIGAITTTFNPLYTSSELEHTCNISRPSLIFASGANLDKAVKLYNKFNRIKHVILIDSIRGYNHSHGNVTLSSILANENQLEFTPVKYSPDDGILILYSSGTTGLPKGVTLVSRAMIYLLQMSRKRKLPAPPDYSYVILVLPMFHGFGIYVAFNCLVHNHTIVVSKRFDESNFLACVEKYKAKFFYLVPPIITLLSKSQLVDQYDLSSMEEIFTGSTTVNVNTAYNVQNRLKLQIYEVYGLTEVTLVCCTSSKNNIKLGSAGKILPGLKCKLIDIETGKSLGPMKQGEICIKGLTIMKGYYGDDEATRKTIDVNNWLHTGDIGYYDEDEYLYIVDRIKELIKYKAYQVAPAELETILLKHEQIKDAAVVGVPDELAEELPKAFIVRKPEATITENDIVQYIYERVSPQKRLTGGVEFIDEIPRNASGKILRRVLKAKIKAKL